MPKSRLAVVLIFAVHGFLFTAWVSRIPEAQDDLNMSEGTLGLVLLGMSIGLIVTLPFAGSLIERFSSQRVTVVSTITYALSYYLLLIAPSVEALFVSMLIFGSNMGLMDMAMNAQGAEVEKYLGKPIMSSFHAMFSIGNFIGAGLSFVVIAIDISRLGHTILFTAITVGVAIFVRNWMIDDEVIEDSQPTPIFSLPQKALLPIGFIAFVSSIGEGSMGDWTAIYLEDIVKTSDSVAVLGFAAFSLMMTVGRLTGDWLNATYNRVTIVRFGGIISTGGLLLAVLLPTAPTAIIGFAAVGAGLSAIIPIAFSTAGNMPGIPSGTGIASVAALGYSGFLAGPPLIGLISELTSLRVGLLMVALLLSTLILAAGIVQPPKQKEAEKFL